MPPPTPSNRSIPPLLAPYLAPPTQSSLTLLTSVLGASANWLVLRYLTAYLLRHPPPNSSSLSQRRHAPSRRRPQAAADDASARAVAAAAAAAAAAEDDGTGTGTGEEEGDEDDITVCLVSFMRDFAFWRDAAGRLGLDLESQSRNHRFKFIDGLTGLFVDPSPSASPTASSPSPPPAAKDTTTSSSILRATSSGLKGIAQTLHAGVDSLLLRHPLVSTSTTPSKHQQQSKVILIIDQPDALLATAGGDGAITGAGLHDLLLDLREKVHSCVVTASADEPLVSAQNTTLEKEHAAFVLSLAHEAETVLSLRLLDTGTANDVSGVVRITHGGDDAQGKVGDAEYLYHVGGDGGVRVFGRGQ